MKHVTMLAVTVLAALQLVASPAGAQEMSTADREGQRIVSEIEAKQADVERYEDDGKDAYRAQAEVYEAVNTGDASTEEMNAAEAALEAAGAQTREAQDQLIELEDDLDDEGTPAQRADYFSDAAADAERMADRCAPISCDEGGQALTAAHGYASDPSGFHSAFSSRAEDLSARADAAAAEIAPETTAAAPPPSAPPPEDAGSADGVDYADSPADPAPQQSPQQPSPYVQPEEGGGGGLNWLTSIILLAVLIGAGAVFGPRLLRRARDLPGGAAVAAAAARVGKPVQARAPEDTDKPDPDGPAPRMGPWRPEPTPPPSVPDEPEGPPEGRIVRVPPKDPSPAPGPTGPSRDDTPPTAPPAAPPARRPGGSVPRSPAAPPARPGAPRNGRPRPRPTASDETLKQGSRPGAPPAAVKDPGPPTAEEKEILRNLPQALRERTIGQDHACDALADAVQGQRTGFGGERPVSVMFCGTTGVGKTETAKALADAMFGGEDKMIRIDMSEYQDKLQASRFVGAPPGYVGHDEEPPLIAKMKEDSRRVVLFDEIEKAHPDILTYLLQILDDGRLTSSKGETLDFGWAVVVMTSNLGAEEIRAAYEAGAESIPEREAMELLREKGLRPELVPRIGEIVMFRPLKAEHIREIARLMLVKTSKKFAAANGATLELTDGAVDWIAEQGYEPENGARPLRGVIKRHVEKLLSKAILQDEISSGDAVTVDVSEGGEGLILRSKARS